METEYHHRLAEIVARYRSGSISRRRAMRLLGALGIAGLAGDTLARSAALAQDATPMPMATPVLGPQADGSNLWKVQVGGMDMEAGIDMQAFFPSEITINAGDSVFWAFAPMGVPGFHTVTFTSGAEIPPIFAPGYRQRHAGRLSGRTAAAGHQPGDRLPGWPNRVRRHRHRELRCRCPSHAGSAAIHGEVHEGRHV